MSEAKHSPEPWTVMVSSGTADGILAAGDMVVCASEHDRLNARPEDWIRIVAAVNAVAGIPTEALEAGALRDALEWLDAWESTDPDGAPNEVVDTLRALGRLP